MLNSWSSACCSGHSAITLILSVPDKHALLFLDYCHSSYLNRFILYQMLAKVQIMIIWKTFKNFCHALRKIKRSIHCKPNDDVIKACRIIYSQTYEAVLSKDVKKKSPACRSYLVSSGCKSPKLLFNSLALNTERGCVWSWALTKNINTLQGLIRYWQVNPLTGFAQSRRSEGKTVWNYSIPHRRWTQDLCQFHPTTLLAVICILMWNSLVSHSSLLLSSIS